MPRKRWKGHMQVRKFGGKDYSLAMVAGPNTKHTSKDISSLLGEPVFVRTTQGKSEPFGKAKSYRITNIWVRDKSKRKRTKSTKKRRKRKKK